MLRLPTVNPEAAYYNAAKYDKAIEYFEKASELNSREFDQYYELGMAYNYEVNYQKAITYLEKAVAVNPNHYDANFQLGLLYYSDLEKPKYKRAIELFQRAKEINPKNADPYYYLGDIYYKTSRYYDALNETKKALDIKKDPFTFSQLGHIYFVMNEYTKALKNYKEAFELNDYYFYAVSIARTLIQLKEYDKAINFLERNIEKYDKDYSKKKLISILATSYQKKGEYSTAIQHYHECLKLYPNDFDAHFKIASCYFDQKNWITAADLWKKAAEINPKSSASFYNIGLAYMNMEIYTGAITYFKKSLDIKPDYNKVKSMIKVCQLEIDRKKFPEKLRKLSYRGDNIGILAKILLFTFEYTKANDLFIQGMKETKPEYSKYSKDIIVSYHVSSKIYESQGRFERMKTNLDKISTKSGRINQILDSFQSAFNQRITGIEEYSRGYYVTAKNYRGEWEKGLAKIKLANTYFVDGLRIIRSELVKYKLDFGEIALQELDDSIKYYQR